MLQAREAVAPFDTASSIASEHRPAAYQDNIQAQATTPERDLVPGPELLCAAIGLSLRLSVELAQRRHRLCDVLVDVEL